MNGMVYGTLGRLFTSNIRLHFYGILLNSIFGGTKYYEEQTMLMSCEN